MIDPTKYRGPNDPDDYRVKVRNSRHYWDPLPADDLRPEGPMIEEERTKVALPAQSTITKAIPSDALLYWAVGKTAEYAVDDREKWEKLDRDDAIDVLKKAHRKSSGDAADRGSSIHEVIEGLLVGEDVDETYLHEDAIPYLPIVRQFFTDQTPELLLSEVVGIGEFHGVTTDAILRLPKLELDLALVDWKTRNDTVRNPHVVYEKEVAQLGANLDVRYWIVEDRETGEGSRLPIPDGLAAVLVTFTTTSYGVHLVDSAKAVAGWRDVLAWSGALKALPKAASGVKVVQLGKSPVAEPVSPEVGYSKKTKAELVAYAESDYDLVLPASMTKAEMIDAIVEHERGSVSPSPDPVPQGEPEAEIVPEIDAPTVSEAHDGMIEANLRVRIEKLVAAGHEDDLVAAWPISVGLSEATPDQYGEIEKTLDRVEAKVGAPFDPPPSEHKKRDRRADVAPPASTKPTIEEGDRAPDEDVEAVRASYGLLEPAGMTWIEDLAGRTGNLSISEKPSARRVLLGWSLVRLAVAGWHDDELLAAVLDRSKISASPIETEHVADVLSSIGPSGAARVSDTVSLLVNDEIKFAVGDTDGRMRLEAS